MTVPDPADAIRSEPDDGNDAQKSDCHYFQKLVELMDTLRGPDGCPWDQEQTPETLKAMLIEESYEVLEALDWSSPAALCDELGDLLLQIVFHSRIARERGEFDIADVCRTIHEKMVRRHPHVFGQARFDTSGELLREWERIKAEEKADRGQFEERKSLLETLPDRLPAIYATYQMSARAARVGFDWPSLGAVGDKVMEEFQELVDAVRKGNETDIREEVGDFLFAAINVARFLQVDPETSLNRANRKFSDRYRTLEEHFTRQGRSLAEVEPEELERQWQSQKQVLGSVGTASSSTVRGESPASTETVPAPAGPGASEGAYREYVSR